MGPEGYFGREWQQVRITAELPVSEWEGHDPEQLTSEEFEEVWGPARRQIASRPSWLSAPRRPLGIIAT